MVIVTTAVYLALKFSAFGPGGLNGSPLNVPAPGRRQFRIPRLAAFARTCVFSKQSLSRWSLRPPPPLRQRVAVTASGPPFLPKLRGAFLPSSLTTVRPKRLGIPLPDHLCRFGVRADVSLARGFSRQHRAPCASPLRAPHHTSAPNGARICLRAGLPCLARDNHPPGERTAFLASPHRSPTTGSGHRAPHNPRPVRRRAGQEAGFSVPCLGPCGPRRVREYQPVIHRLRPVGLALGPDSPWAEQPGPGTLGLPAPRIPTADISLTHACIPHPAPPPPPGLTPGLPRRCGAPLPNTHPAPPGSPRAAKAPIQGTGVDTASAVRLSPAYIIGAEPT